MDDLEADRVYDSILSILEVQLAREMIAYFDEINKAIEQMILNGGTLANYEIDEHVIELRVVLEQAYREAIIKGAEFIRQDLDVTEEDTGSDDEILLLLLFWRNEQAQSQARYILDTTKDVYQSLITEGQALGMTQEELAEFVSKEGFSRNRSRLPVIATTEIGQAIQKSVFEIGSKIGGLKKKWRSQRDYVVRETHSTADSRYSLKPINLDEYFSVGASRGLYPLHSDLSFIEKVNCRCYLRFVKLKK